MHLSAIYTYIYIRTFVNEIFCFFSIFWKENNEKFPPVAIWPAMMRFLASVFDPTVILPPPGRIPQQMIPVSHFSNPMMPLGVPNMQPPPQYLRQQMPPHAVPHHMPPGVYMQHPHMRFLFTLIDWISFV